MTIGTGIVVSIAIICLTLIVLSAIGTKNNGQIEDIREIIEEVDHDLMIMAEKIRKLEGK